MAKEKNPNRDKAYQIWLEHKGDIANRKISEIVGEDEKKIAVWKQRDKWNVVQHQNNVVQQKKAGAPKGNKNATGYGAPKRNGNAVGNKGGRPAPGNKNAEKHGFFSRIFPDDPETKAIIESIDIMSPIEMLWQNIVIQYTAIARAQRIMFVQDKDDQTKVLSKQKESDGDTSSSWEKQWDIQHAWDKQASFMQAQSKAMTTLQGMITKYDELMQKDLATEEQQLRIRKLKAEIAKIAADPTNDKGGQVVVVHSIPRPPKE